MGSLALSRMRGSESERTDDGEDGDGDGEERKYKCTIDGCDRRYKNLQGVKSVYFILFLCLNQLRVKLSRTPHFLQLIQKEVQLLHIPC